MLCADGGVDAVALPKPVARNPRLLFLRGGYAAWQREVMAPGEVAGLRDADAIEAALRRDAVRSYFSGEGLPRPAPPSVPVVPARRRPHSTLGPVEGC